MVVWVMAIIMVRVMEVIPMDMEATIIRVTIVVMVTATTAIAKIMEADIVLVMEVGTADTLDKATIIMELVIAITAVGIQVMEIITTANHTVTMNLIT